MLKLILASVLFTACTTDATLATYEPQRPHSSSMLGAAFASDHGDQQTITVVESADRRGTTVLSDDQADPVDLTGSPCACETVECLQDWAQSTVGCNIIVDLVCADGRRSAFSPCGAPIEPMQASAGTRK